MKLRIYKNTLNDKLYAPDDELDFTNIPHSPFKFLGTVEIEEPKKIVKKEMRGESILDEDFLIPLEARNIVATYEVEE